jgi:hypothetical protein
LTSTRYWKKKEKRRLGCHHDTRIGRAVIRKIASNNKPGHILHLRTCLGRLSYLHGTFGCAFAFGGMTSKPVYQARRAHIVTAISFVGEHHFWLGVQIEKRRNGLAIRDIRLSEQSQENLRVAPPLFAEVTRRVDHVRRLDGLTGLPRRRWWRGLRKGYVAA